MQQKVLKAIFGNADADADRNTDKEHLLDGTKEVKGRHDKFVAMDSPFSSSGERIMIQFKLMSFNVFSLFTPIGSDNVQFGKDVTTFQWYEYKKDGVIDTTADEDVTKDIDKIDTSNSILALKEYRHFFQYLFVNKRHFPMTMSCEKMTGHRFLGKAKH